MIQYNDLITLNLSGLLQSSIYITSIDFDTVSSTKYLQSHVTNLVVKDEALMRLLRKQSSIFKKTT